MLYVKSMVSTRCKMMVGAALRELGFNHAIVHLGEVEVNEPISEKQRNKLKAALLRLGMELLDDKNAVLIDRIKTIIVGMVYASSNRLPIPFSKYLSERLNHDYTYLANIFSKQQGTTIEKFIIDQKIERVKALLLDKEFNLTEIAFKMHYSSVAHLSNQFKKITGLTPSEFKKV